MPVSPAFAEPQKDDLTALYFFSTTCSHCKSVEPAVKDLSREFKIQGLVYGKGNPEPMPFEVRKGDKATADKYGVNGVPALVVLKNGILKQIIRGENDIRDARPVLRAFRKGALTVSEAIEAIVKGPQNGYIVTGWVESRGEYFKDVKFFLTDRQKTISIKPWLPLEAVKGLMRNARPRLMSDVIGKPVVLEGTVKKTGADLQFIVGREIANE